MTALLQAQKHGVPMAETLRIQSAEMRLKRKQRTEEKAAKLTVKMIFPIVLCFMPVFVIVTVVPAFLTLANSSRPKDDAGLWGPPVGGRRRCGRHRRLHASRGDVKEEVRSRLWRVEEAVAVGVGGGPSGPRSPSFR